MSEGEVNKRSVKKSKDDGENVVKITISKDAADELASFVGDVNSGFDGGRVYRQDLASWIILKFCRSRTEGDLTEVRREHFNETMMLEAMYRKMKETGEIPEFLRDALRKQIQSSAEPPKKVRRSLTKGYINELHSKNEDAI